MIWLVTVSMLKASRTALPVATGAVIARPRYLTSRQLQFWSLYQSQDGALGFIKLSLSNVLDAHLGFSASYVARHRITYQRECGELRSTLVNEWYKVKPWACSRL